MADKIGIALTSIDGFPVDASAGLRAASGSRRPKSWSPPRACPTARAALADHLSISEQAMVAPVAAAEDVLPAAARSFDLEEEYPTGALDEPEELPASREVAFGVEELPSKIDYHDRLPPPRHEGGVAPASHSQAWLRANFCWRASTAADLSEQFLYWACKGRVSTEARARSSRWRWPYWRTPACARRISGATTR